MSSAKERFERVLDEIEGRRPEPKEAAPVETPMPPQPIQVQQPVPVPIPVQPPYVPSPWVPVPIPWITEPHEPGTGIWYEEPSGLRWRYYTTDNTTGNIISPTDRYDASQAQQKGPNDGNMRYDSSNTMMAMGFSGGRPSFVIG